MVTQSQTPTQPSSNSMSSGQILPVDNELPSTQMQTETYRHQQSRQRVGEISLRVRSLRRSVSIRTQASGAIATWVLADI